MARLTPLPFLALLALFVVGCGSTGIMDTYNATMTAAAYTHAGTGGQIVYPTYTPPVPGMELIGAEFAVTQAAISAQSAQTVADQTRTAYQYAAALATLQAQQAIATQVAPATFAAATAQSDQATRTAYEVAAQGAVRATVSSADAGVSVAQANAQVTIEYAAASGTATAIARVADIEEQARLAQQEELAIANQRARGKAVLSWLVPLLIVVGLFMFVGALSFRVVVQARPRVIDNEGGRIITYDHTGQPMLSAPPRRPLLTGPAVDETPEQSPVMDNQVVDLPDTIHNVVQVGVYEGGRPVHLGPGFMGIQVTGQKGSGKSSLLRLMAAQALAHGWEVFYADAEALTFDPDLWGPVAQSTADARLLFKWLRQEVFVARHDL